MIEKVQRKYLRAVYFRCHRANIPYCQLLTRYKLLTLAQRRTMLGAMMLYGLCHNRVDCRELTNKLCYVVPRTARRRAARAVNLFATGSCRTNAGLRAPLRRLTHSYNQHFEHIDIFALSESKFRNRIRSNPNIIYLLFNSLLYTKT